jgi:hypothetical protein
MLFGEHGINNVLQFYTRFLFFYSFLTVFSFFFLDGFKDASKRKKPLICQFFSSTFEECLLEKSVVVLEGKYWKRKLESITNEYKKWREFSRKKIKSFSLVSANILINCFNLKYIFLIHF